MFMPCGVRDLVAPYPRTGHARARKIVAKYKDYNFSSPAARQPPAPTAHRRGGARGPPPAPPFGGLPPCGGGASGEAPPRERQGEDLGPEHLCGAQAPGRPPASAAAPRCPQSPQLPTSHPDSPLRSSRSESPGGKSRRRRAYPQQIVTTRLLYCLQDPFAQLSRLQRI